MDELTSAMTVSGGWKVRYGSSSGISTRRFINSGNHSWFGQYGAVSVNISSSSQIFVKSGKVEVLWEQVCVHPLPRTQQCIYVNIFHLGMGRQRSATVCQTWLLKGLSSESPIGRKIGWHTQGRIIHSVITSCRQASWVCSNIQFVWNVLGSLECHRVRTIPQF